MASLFDAILVKGSMRYRLNKNFISEDKVPEQVKSVLTTDNIVDENGMIIVDSKKPEANAPTEENAKELEETPAATSKLPRVDAPQASEGEPQNPITPTQIDDSANSGQEGTTDATSTSNPTETTEPPKSTAPPVVAPVAPQTAAPTQATTPPVVEAPVPQKPARAAKPVEQFKSTIPQSKPGMGFPRKNGRTSDIFEIDVPHTHVKLVAGHAVPLSAKNYKEKTDGQIMARLEELGFTLVDYNRLEREQNFAGATNGPDLLLEDDEVDEDISLG